MAHALIDALVKGSIYFKTYVVKKMDFVSVIVVNYNGREFIGECIDSVLASNYPEFEIIVVDNGSNDGSYDFLEKKYGQEKKVRLIRSGENLFFTGGSNLGAKHTKGEWLFFLNSDAVVEPDCIAKLLRFIRNKPKHLVQPKILKQPQGKRLSLKNLKSSAFIIDNAGGRLGFLGAGYGIGHGEEDKGQYDKNYPVDFVNGTAFMISREFFIKLGGFDERYRFFYEDVDLCLRAKKIGGESWYCYKAVVYHKGGASIAKNMNKWEIKKKVWQSIILLAQKKINRWHKDLVNRKRLQELKKIIGRIKFSLLDLGCGDGSFIKVVHQQGMTAVGVDKKAHSGDWFIQSRIEDLRVKNQFDVVAMYHVLEHVENPVEVLVKVKKWLKTGGVFVLEVPLIGNFTEKFLGEDYFAYADRSHRHFFTEKEIKRMLKYCGFRIVKKGMTWYEFPFTIITSSFRKSRIRGFIGISLFVPFKFLSMIGYNQEIARYYCILP